MEIEKVYQEVSRIICNNLQIVTSGNLLLFNILGKIYKVLLIQLTYPQILAQSINVLQEIAECHRDFVMRAYAHVNNNHKSMLPVQLEELKKVKNCILNLLEKTSDALMKKQIPDSESIIREKQKLNRMIAEFDKNQVKRIQDNSSKTRLSILFYGFTRDSKIITDQTFSLLKIFQESFPLNKK